MNTTMVQLIVSILLGACGQLFLKIASIGGNSGSLFSFYMSLAKNINLWIGFGCYGLSFFIWLKVLSKYDLSFARPMAGLGYVVAALLAWLILGEKISLVRWLGILLIVSGVIIVGITGCKA